MQYWNLFQP